MPWFLTEPNWIISALIGAFLGWLLPYTFQLIMTSLKRLKKIHIEGKWYEYHTTYLDDNPIIYETKWEIKKGWLKQFNVEIEQINKKMSYFGEMEIERGYLIASLTSPDSQVSVEFRLNYPLPSKNELIGIWLSFDHDIKICSGATVLTRNSLSADEALYLIKSKFKHEFSMPLIRLKT